MHDLQGCDIRIISDYNYRNLMCIVCSFTSAYFLIYDDEYRGVHYDDDDDHHHALHDIRGFVVPPDSQLARL